jgi:myosin heavy subunit
MIRLRTFLSFDVLPIPSHVQDFVSLMVSSEDPVLRSIFEHKGEQPGQAEPSKPSEPAQKAAPIRGRRQPGSGPTGRPQSGNYTGQTANAAAKVSVTSNFRQDLTKLVATLSASERHYVRCIKVREGGREIAFSFVFNPFFRIRGFI